jgi:hypothetical protein
MRAIAAACWVACLAAVSQAQEPKVVDLNSVRLYLPDETLRQRLGDNVSPLGEYIKLLQKETAAFCDKAEKPKAKGLLITVGVKPGKKARVWCDAVDGEVPAETLAQLEKKLEEVAPVAIKHGPIAFAVEIKLWGQKPEKFPEMPKAWKEAAKKSKEPLLIPDGLFKAIWPDGP